MALSVLFTAYRDGVRVPDDLGMVGFDNLSESAYHCPPLSGVDNDVHQLGHRAVKELVRVIDARRREDPAPDPVALTLSARLLVRESSLRVRG